MITEIIAYYNLKPIDVAIQERNCEHANIKKTGTIVIEQRRVLRQLFEN